MDKSLGLKKCPFLLTCTKCARKKNTSKKQTKLIMDTLMHTEHPSYDEKTAKNNKAYT